MQVDYPAAEPAAFPLRQDACAKTLGLPFTAKRLRKAIRD